MPAPAHIKVCYPNKRRGSENNHVLFVETCWSKSSFLIKRDLSKHEMFVKTPATNWHRVESIISAVSSKQDKVSQRLPVFLPNLANREAAEYLSSLIFLFFSCCHGCDWQQVKWPPLCLLRRLTRNALSVSRRTVKAGFGFCCICFCECPHMLNFLWTHCFSCACSLILYICIVRHYVTAHGLLHGFCWSVYYFVQQSTAFAQTYNMKCIKNYPMKWQIILWLIIHLHNQVRVFNLSISFMSTYKQN